MSTDASRPADTPPPGQFTRLWDRFISALFAVAAGYLTLIAVTTIWAVVARNLEFRAPLWLGTFAEFGMAISALLAAPFLVRERGHVSMELIDGALSAVQRARLVLATDLVCAATSLVIAWFALRAGHDAFVRNEIDIQAIDIPRWIMFGFLVTGFSLSAIEFLRHAWRSARRGGDDVAGSSETGTANQGGDPR